MASASGAPFAFVQLEYAHPLGPADGRYLTRRGAGEPPQRVLVLRTLGAPQRRLLGRGRRPSAVESAEDASPVPTARATVIRAEGLGSPAEAASWLERVRGDEAARDAEVADAVAALNGAIRAHRAAAADPYARDVTRAGASVARIGYGSGEQVAEGHFDEAYELPPPARGRERRAEALAPQERLAAILGGSHPLLASEELVLRARADLDAGRPREAALQARIALETLLAELRPGGAAERLAAVLGELGGDREAVGRAANEALAGDPSAELQDDVADCVERMQRALRIAARDRAVAGA